MGGASVWKVGGKIFAISSNKADDPFDYISFKCSDLSFDILKEQAGLVPAPYLARAKWIQVESPGGLGDAALRDYITEAHRIIALKLSKKKRSELNLHFE